MAEPLVSDALWALIAPLLPERPPRPKGGRPPLDDRKALEGIVFVLRTGIPWASLPQELGFGSGMTCWRKLRDWQAAGVFERLHRALLDRLGRANAIDWSRCSLDSASVPAKGGRTHWPEPDRPRQARHQAPRHCRCPRHPARAPAQRRERPRQPALRAAARRRAADPAVRRAAAEAPGQAARRQGLRFVNLASCLEGSRHHPPDRATGSGVERTAGVPPMGGRALAVVDARVPPPRPAVRAVRRPAAGAAPPGVCPDLPPPVGVPERRSARHAPATPLMWPPM